MSFSSTHHQGSSFEFSFKLMRDNVATASLENPESNDIGPSVDQYSIDSSENALAYRSISVRMIEDIECDLSSNRTLDEDERNQVEYQMKTLKENQKILIVDDMPFNVQAIRMILQNIFNIDLNQFTQNA